MFQNKLLIYVDRVNAALKHTAVSYPEYSCLFSQQADAASWPKIKKTLDKRLTAQQQAFLPGQNFQVSTYQWGPLNPFISVRFLPKGRFFPPFGQEKIILTQIWGFGKVAHDGFLHFWEFYL